MTSGERVVPFECRAEPLIGILHEAPGAAVDLGVLIIVGGPQYRVGSHRQFVLTARALAAAGYPTFRFDYRGMGDSGAVAQPFHGVDDDIRSALDIFMQQVPGLNGVVLYGLCDGASAAMIYAAQDARVAGLILANPWVRTEAGEARAYVRHYYVQRLFSGSFWRKLLKGELRALSSARDLIATLRKSTDATHETTGFVGRMLEGIRQYRGRSLLLLSGRDLTAAEFADLAAEDAAWRDAIGTPRFQVERLPQCDHTFSTRDDLARANAACLAWLKSLRREATG